MANKFSKSSRTADSTSNVKSPGGIFDKTLSVALEGSMLGQGNNSIDEIIAKGIAAVCLGGNAAGNIKGTGDLVNKSKDGIINISKTIASNINTIFDALKSLNKQNESMYNISKNINTLLKNVFNESLNAIYVKQITDNKGDINDDDAKLDKSLNIILSCDTLPEILSMLQNITNDESVLKLNIFTNSLQNLHENLQNIINKNFQENSEVFVESINGISLAIESLFNNINNKKFQENSELFIENINGISLAIESIFDNINNSDATQFKQLITDINLAINDVNNIKLDIKLNKKDIQKIYDLLTPLINYKSEIVKLNNLYGDITFDKIDNTLSLLYETLNKYNNKINIKDIDNKFIAINSILKNISELDVNTKLSTKIVKLNALLNEVKNIDFEYDKNKLKFNGLDSSIQDISNVLSALSELKVNAELPTKISDLTALLTAINSIDFTYNKDKFKVKGLDGSINDMSNVLSALSELNVNTELSNKIDNLKTLLNDISNIEFVYDKNKLKVKGLDSSIQNISTILTALSELDVNAELSTKISDLSTLFEELSELKINFNVKNSELNKVSKFLGDQSKINEILDELYDLYIDEDLVNVLNDNVNLLKSFINNVSEIQNIENAVKNLYAITGLISKLKEVNDTITLKDTFLIDLKFELLTDITLSLQNIISKLCLLGKTAQYIPMLIDDINNINFADVQKVDFSNLSKILEDLNKISNNINNIKGFDLNKIDEIKEFINNVFNNDDSILKIVLDINIPDSDLKKASDNISALTNVLENIAVIGLYASVFTVIAPFAIAGIFVLKYFMKQLIIIIQGLQQIDNKEIARLDGIMSDIGDLILTSAFTMIIGGFIMLHYPQLIMGSFAFALTLGAFLLVTLSSISIASNLATGKHMEDLDNVSLMIITCGTIMVFGALFMLIPGLAVAALSFGITFGAFLTLALLPITIAQIFLKKDLEKTMASITLLVVGAATVMMIGALFMLIPGMFVSALKFTVAFGLFLTAIMLPLFLTSRSLRHIDFDGIVGLVITSTLLMIIGGLFVKNHLDIIINGLAFGVLLGIFLFTVVGAIRLGAKGLNQTFKSLAGVTLLVVASGILLLFAAQVIGNDLNKAIGIAIFTGVLALLLFAVTKITKYIDKNLKLKSVLSSIVLMAAIGALIMMGAAAMNIIAESTKGTNLKQVALTALLMCGVIAAVSALAIGLIAIGTIPGIGPTAIAAASLALIGIGTLILLTANAIKIMVESMILFEKVKPIKTGVIISNIGAIISIGMAFGGLSIIAGPIAIGTATVFAMTLAISNLSETVADVAALKVPIYNGTKKVGYKQLNKTDFTKAAENINSLLTTMSGAIMNVYKSDPKMFSGGLLSLLGDHPVHRVINSFRELGSLISNISEGVKDYAELKIPIYNGTKKVGYKNLTDNDFNSAATNISLVLTTLSRAIISTYDASPDLFYAGKLQQLGIGKSKFDIVLKSVRNVGKLISSISSGISDYANLKYPIDWNNKGKAIKYKQLTQTDFTDAANNIKNIITTLGNTIISIYDNNQNLFYAGTLQQIGIGKSKFDIVSKSVRNIGKLLSSISSGIQDYANLKYPIDWNNNGRAIKYNRMTNSDIQKAKENISNIITSLADSIINVYNIKPELFADPYIGKSPFNSVLTSCTNMGKMISSISDGLVKYANLKYPIGWDTKTGKPNKFRSITKNDITNASENVKLILTTLASTIVEIYDTKPTLFEGDGLFGTGKSKFDKIVKSSIGLSKLLESVFDSIKKYAKLQYPNKWNNNGKAIGYAKITGSDIKTAGENVAQVIKTLAESVINVYDNNKPLFDEGRSGIFGSGSSKFDKIVKSASGLTKLLGDTFEGINKYSKLQYASKWNSNGKAIEYTKITSEDIKTAGENVAVVITTLANAISAAYDNNKPLFDAPASGVFGLTGQSKFDRISKSFTAITKLVSDISTGVCNIATLQYASEWNKDGKAIKYTKMTSNDFTSAADNIKTILSTITGALIEIYDEKPEYFEEPESTGLFGFIGIPGKSKVSKVLSSIGTIGVLLTDVATGLQGFAELKFVKEYDSNGNPTKYTTITDNDITQAGTNIKSVIKAIAESLIELYNENPKMFAPVKSSLKDYIVGAGSETSPVGKVMSAIGGMGNLVAGVATGVKEFADMKFATGYDSEGKATGYVNISNSDLKQVGTNIGSIITAIGSALITTFNNNDMFKDETVTTKTKTGWGLFSKSKTEVVQGSSPMARIMRSLNGMGDLVFGIARGLKDLSQMKIATGYDANGNPTGYENMKPADLTAAANTAKNIITTLGNAILEIGEGKTFTDYIKANTYTMPIINTLSNSLTDMAQGLIIFGTGKAPIMNKVTGELIGYTDTIDFDTAKENVEKICKTLVNALADVSEGKFEQTLNKALIASQSIANVGPALLPIAESLLIFAKGNVQTKNGEATIDFDAAAKTAGSVLTALAGTIIDIYNSGDKEVSIGWGLVKFNFNTYKKAVDTVLPTLSAVGPMLKPLAESLVIFGSGEVPTKYDSNGKVIESKPINFITAANTAQSVMSTLVGAIVNLYNGKGIGDTKYTFIFSDFKNAKDNVLPLISDVYTLLAALAQSLYYYGISSVPTKFDKNGNPIAFKQIDFITASNVAGQVLSTLGNAVISVSKGTWFREAIIAKDYIMPIIHDINNILSSLSTSLSAFAMGKIPSGYDSKGNPTGYTKIDNFENIAKTVSSVLETLPKGVITVSQSHDWESEKNDINVVFEVLDEILKRNGTIAKSLQGYANDVIPIEFDQNGNPTKFQAIKLETASEAVSNIVKNLAFGIKTLIEDHDWNKYKNESKRSFEVLDNYIQNASNVFILVKKYADNSDKLDTSSIGTTLTNLTISLKTYHDTYKDTLKTLNKLDIFDITYKQIKKINKIINVIDTTKLIKFDNLNRNITNLSETLNNVKNVLINNLTTFTTDIQNIDTTIASDAVTSLTVKIKSLYNSLNNLNTNGEDNNLFTRIIKNTTSSPLESFTNDINYFNNVLGSISDSDLILKTSGLASGIDNIREKINLVDDDNTSAKFKKHNEDLKTYVQTINSIKVESIDSITQMLNALHKLGLNMGNMDKLAEAIADNLSVSLSNVSNVIKDFNESYKNEINYKNERKKEIENSLNKVRTLMNKTMQIEVNGKNLNNGTSLTPSGSSTGDDKGDKKDPPNSDKQPGSGLGLSNLLRNLGDSPK